MPVFLPKLGSKMNKTDHVAILPFAFSLGNTQHLPQGSVNELLKLADFIKDMTVECQRFVVDRVIRGDIA
jgi:hypothetical protein